MLWKMRRPLKTTMSRSIIMPGKGVLLKTPWTTMRFLFIARKVRRLLKTLGMTMRVLFIPWKVRGLLRMPGTMMKSLFIRGS
jgi:hypothetical protein